MIWIDQDYLTQRYVVAHEELHFILNGDPRHKRPEWRQCFLT